MIESNNYRHRKSARVIVVSSLSRILLFRFIYKDGPLAGYDYWATPGGELEDEESYESAAIRELHEETGINVVSVGLPVAHKEFIWQMPDGEEVMAIEKYFVVDTLDEVVIPSKWTANEMKFIFEYKWWSEFDLTNTKEVVWPSNIISILKAASEL